MNRREALSRVALIMGGTVIGANIFLQGCKPADKKSAESLTDFRRTTLPTSMKLQKLLFLLPILREPKTPKLARS